MPPIALLDLYAEWMRWLSSFAPLLMALLFLHAALHDV